MQSYQNLAARTDAALIKYPPEVALTKQLAAPAASTPVEETPQQTPHGPHDAAEADAAPPSKRHRLGSRAHAAEDVLVDDDIDWTQAEQTQPKSEATDAEQGVHTSVHEAAAIPTALVSDSSKMQSQDSQPAVNETRPPDKRVGRQNSEHNAVQHAVNGYIRAFLDPFYKAGIVTREVNA